MSVILNYNILIVDDEDDYREMFALILEEKDIILIRQLL